MMTDRFDAQLRAHLLSAADTKPAEGQLAGVLKAVAGTSQRASIAARLTWFPGRIGPVPTRTLRYGLVALALVAATITAAILVGNGLRERSTVFEGTWLSIDPGDGSQQRLVVGEGTTPTLQFVDANATGPGCADDPVKVFTADGTGTIAGNRLEVSFPNGGGCGLRTVPVGIGYLDYDEATDTIVDAERLTWRRAADGVPAPTRAPVTGPTPTPVAQADCIQFDAPATYTAVAGSLALTVTVGKVGDNWAGSRERFELLKMACSDSQGIGKVLAAEVTRVTTDACAGASVPVRDTASVAAAVSGATGLEVLAQTVVQINDAGDTATRLDVRALDAPSACPGQRVAIAGGIDGLDPGQSLSLYLIDVGDRPLVIALYGYTDLDATVRAQVDEIIGSLAIEGITMSSFTSTIHGFSIEYPLGWQTRAATQPWAGEALTFDSAAADVISEPVLGGRVHLEFASQPYEAGSESQWRDAVLRWLCNGDGAALGSWTVDETDAIVIGCGSTRSGLIAFTAGRAYLLRLVVPADDSLLAELYDWDLFKRIVSTADLRPEDAIDNVDASP